MPSQVFLQKYTKFPDKELYVFAHIWHTCVVFQGHYFHYQKHTQVYFFFSFLPLPNGLRRPFSLGQFDENLGSSEERVTRNIWRNLKEMTEMIGAFLATTFGCQLMTKKLAAMQQWLN
jgi:hypothetical protein